MTISQPSLSTRPSGPRAHRITWTGTFRAEAIRFWSLVSNRWSVLAAVLSTAILGAMDVAFWSGDGDPFSSPHHTATALSGIFLTQVVVGVVGAVNMTSEYAHGGIASSMLAVPRRSWVLTAKAAVLAAVFLPATLASGVLSFYVTGFLMERDGLAVQSLADPGVFVSVLGGAAYLTAIALIGLGVGTLMRSTAGAVSVVTAGTFVLPELARMMLPSSVFDVVGPYLPTSAGEALWTPVAMDGLLSRPMGALVLGAWLLVVLGAGAVALSRRDT